MAAEEFGALADQREFLSRFGPDGLNRILEGANGMPCRISRAEVWNFDWELGTLSAKEFGDTGVKTDITWLPPYYPSLGDVGWLLKFGTDCVFLGPTVRDFLGGLTVRVPPTGPVGFGSEATDITLSTTVGIYTMIVRALNVPIVSGHTYRVAQGGGHTILTGGGTYAFSDAWDFRLRVDEGAGFVGLTYGGAKRIRDNEDHAGAKRYAFPEIMGYHIAAGTGDATFNFEATKASGAAALTTIAVANAGASPFTILVEDLGIMGLGE